MSGYFENIFLGLELTITNLVSNEKYSFLLLNENFRQKIYLALDEEIFNEIEPNIIDVNFIRTLIKYKPMALSFIGDVWQSNREIVILAVTNDGLALEFAANEFKSDKKIVLLAVTNNKNSLVFASEEIIVAAANCIIDGIVYNLW